MKGKSGAGNSKGKQKEKQHGGGGGAGGTPATRGPEKVKSDREKKNQQQVNGLKNKKPPVSFVNAKPEGDVDQKYLKIATICGLYVNDGMELPFELLLFAYSLVHLALQNYNIYRTNVLDVDFYAFTFSLAALFRRFLWKMCQEGYLKWSKSFSDSEKSSPNTPTSHPSGSGSANSQISFYQQPGLSLLITGGVGVIISLIVSMYCTFSLGTRYAGVKVTALLLPAVLYVVCSSRLAHPTPEKIIKIADAVTDEKTQISKGISLPLSRAAFKSLWQGVAYAGLTNAYYSGVIPVLYVTSDHVYWPPVRSRLLTVVVFLNTVLLILVKKIGRNYLEYLSNAQTFGNWVPTTEEHTSEKIQIWRPGTPYRCGSLVRFHPDLVPAKHTDSASIKVDDKLLATATIYEGQGFTNCGVPGEINSFLSWTLFSAPFKTQATLSLIQLAVSLLLLMVAVQAVAWVPVSIIVSFNYIILYVALQAKRTTRSDKTISLVLSRLTAPHL